MAPDMESDRERLDDRVQAAAEEMEADVEEMEARSEEVGEHIDETRSEWRSKQADSSVPGAEADAEEIAGDSEGEGPAADEADQADQADQ